MATFREYLIARRDAIGLEVSQFTETVAPEYKAHLYAELEMIDARLRDITSGITSATPSTAGPFTIIQRGVS